MEKKTEQYDVVIIGGGAAGLTAGIYCGRAKLKTLLLEKSLVGGLATYTNEIENYPGFPEGTTGTDLMELFHKQAKKFGVDFKMTDVKSVSVAEDIKVVETFRVRYECKVIIIASGENQELPGQLMKICSYMIKEFLSVQPVTLQQIRERRLWLLAVVMQLLKKECF